MTYREQLNAAAALEVMGWCRSTIDDNLPAWANEQGEHMMVATLWNPCDRFWDARWVIRKMQEKGYSCHVCFRGGGVVADFVKAGASRGHHDHRNELVAVTTAAIIACGGLGALPIEGGA